MNSSEAQRGGKLQRDEQSQSEPALRGLFRLGSQDGPAARSATNLDRLKTVQHCREAYTH